MDRPGAIILSCVSVADTIGAHPLPLALTIPMQAHPTFSKCQSFPDEVTGINVPGEYPLASGRPHGRWRIYIPQLHPSLGETLPGVVHRSPRGSQRAGAPVAHSRILLDNETFPSSLHSRPSYILCTAVLVGGVLLGQHTLDRQERGMLL